MRWPSIIKTLWGLPLVAALLFSGGESYAQPAFAIGRIHYSGGGDWYSDPSSLVNLQKYASETLGIPVARREKNVRLTDDDLYQYPYLYMTGHGTIRLSEEEAVRLREYLLAGGFLHADDNYGMDESFRRTMKQVFPDRELVELPFDHPVYHTRFDFPWGLPKIHEHDGKPAQGFAIVVDERVVVFYSYECDLVDGWEDQPVHDVPEEKRQAALKMGVNLIAYALSGKPVTLP